MSIYKQQNMPGAIYIFTSPQYSKEGKYKIGMVGSIKRLPKRERELSCGSIDAGFLATWHLDDRENSNTVEKSIHDDLKKKGKFYKREWFKFKNDAECINYVVSRLNKNPSTCTVNCPEKKENPLCGAISSVVSFLTNVLKK